jgi:hypothetical protein
LPRFTQSALDQIAEHLREVGLSTCPVCRSAESLVVSTLPYFVPIGGHEHNVDQRDGYEANLLAASVECKRCGHVVLFNTRRFYTGDSPIITGLPLGEEPKGDKAGDAETARRRLPTIPGVRRRRR